MTARLLPSSGSYCNVMPLASSYVLMNPRVRPTCQPRWKKLKNTRVRKTTRKIQRSLSDHHSRTITKVIRKNMRASFTRGHRRRSRWNLFVFVLLLLVASFACGQEEEKEEEEGGGGAGNVKRKVPQRIPNEEKKKYIVTLKSRYESLRLCKLNKQLN